MDRENATNFLDAYADYKDITADESGMAMQEAPNYGVIKAEDLGGMTFCFYADIMAIRPTT